MQFQQMLFEKRQTTWRRGKEGTRRSLRTEGKAAGGGPVLTLQGNLPPPPPRHPGPRLLGSVTQGKVQRVTQWQNESCGPANWRWGGGGGGEAGDVRASPPSPRAPRCSISFPLHPSPQIPHKVRGWSWVLKLPQQPEKRGGSLKGSDPGSRMHLGTSD